MLLPAKTVGDDNSRTFEYAGDVRKNRGGCARGACLAQAKPFGKCDCSRADACVGRPHTSSPPKYSGFPVVHVSPQS